MPLSNSSQEWFIDKYHNAARSHDSIMTIQSFKCANCSVNSLAPGKFEWNFRQVIFKNILVIDGWDISWEIALILMSCTLSEMMNKRCPITMSLDFTNDQSTLVQVMAWCRHATSHYLSQCWPRSLSPFLHCYVPYPLFQFLEFLFAKFGLICNRQKKQVFMCNTLRPESKWLALSNHFSLMKHIALWLKFCEVLWR